METHPTLRSQVRNALLYFAALVTTTSSVADMVVQSRVGSAGEHGYQPRLIGSATMPAPSESLWTSDPIPVRRCTPEPAEAEGEDGSNHASAEKGEARGRAQHAGSRVAI